MPLNILVWILGTLFSYLAWRMFLRIGDEYTIRARLWNIICSIIFSWGSFGALLIMLLVLIILLFWGYLSDELDWNAKAKW